MFYDKSDETEWKKARLQAEEEAGAFEAAFVDDEDQAEDEQHSFLFGDSVSQREQSGWSPFTRDYEREVIESIWEFAEIVSGVDPVLWRKDEFGDWIHRPDYGKNQSKFGWKIFDPGVGRHSQGVSAMRPMQWENYVEQFSSTGS